MTRLLLLLSLVACSATTRHVALSTATATLDAAEVGVVAYDETRQSKISTTCSSEPECVKQLAEYRAKRTALQAQIAAALTAVEKAWKLDTNASAAAAVGAAEAIAKDVEAWK